MVQIIIPQSYYPIMEKDDMDMYVTIVTQTVELIQAYLGVSKKLALMSEYWCPEGFLHPKQQREFIPWVEKLMEEHSVNNKVTIYTFSPIFLKSVERSKIVCEQSKEFTPQEPSLIKISNPLIGSVVSL